METIIDRASPADAYEILELLKKAGGESDNLSFGAEGLPYTQEEEAAYISQILASFDELMLVARIDEKIVGIASLLHSAPLAPKRGNFSVTVLKDFWNMGVGSKLTSEIIAFARLHHFEIIDLELRSDNLRAIGLYEKFKFKRVDGFSALLNKNGKDIPLIHMSFSIT